MGYFKSLGYLNKQINTAPKTGKKKKIQELCETFSPKTRIKSKKTDCNKGLSGIRNVFWITLSLE